MAGDWIPFDHDLPDKPEVIAIAAESGATIAETVLRLCRLWCWFDRMTVDGKMRGVGIAGVALMCGGDEVFWEAVIRQLWLSINGKDVSIPKFRERFGNSARRRLLTAKRVTLHRLLKKSNAPSVTKALRSASQEPQPQPQPQPLSEPLSVPLSVPEPQEDSGASAPCAAEAARNGRGDEIRQVFAHYRTYHPRAFTKPCANTKEWRLIQARLAEGYTVDDLKAAIDGNQRSPFHCGENDRGKEYHSLELIVRDGSKVSQFMEVPERSVVLSEKDRRTQRALDGFLGGMEPNEPN